MSELRLTLDDVGEEIRWLGWHRKKVIMGIKAPSEHTLALIEPADHSKPSGAQITAIKRFMERERQVRYDTL